MALWRAIQGDNFRSWEKLFHFLELDVRLRGEIVESSPFPLNLPRRLAEKVEKGNLRDPVLLQFLPLQAERVSTEGFSCDPVGEGLVKKSSKLLHKYQGRALLICTSACAMHCRFCFRREFDYDREKSQFAEELEMIQQDSSLSEIILSGGDPLSLSNEVLGNLLDGLGRIEHVKRIRFHSRFPLGIPERIDPEFLEMLSKVRQQVVFVIHCNHPRELDGDVIEALKQIQRLAIPVISQTVLLKGVNDDLSVLIELFETMIDHGIIPYYLHQLDRVQGTAHFEVDEERGMELMKELSKRLPGYGVPRFVKEISGAESKTEITSGRGF